MKDQSFSKKLNKESRERTEMINDALEAMTNYSDEIIKKDTDLEQYKIEEIKYKTTIKELNDYIKIYENKLEKLESTNESQDKELISLRKKVLKNEVELSSLKSILEIFINEFGIDKISEVTKLEKEKLLSFTERD